MVLQYYRWFTTCSEDVTHSIIGIMARLLCIAGSVISQTRLDWSDEPTSHLLEWCSILIMFSSHRTINVMIPNYLPYCYGDSALSGVIVIRLWEGVGAVSQLSSVDLFFISPSNFCFSLLSLSPLYLSLYLYPPPLSLSDGNLYSALSAVGRHPGSIRRTYGTQKLLKTETKWLQSEWDESNMGLYWCRRAA